MTKFRIGAVLALAALAAGCADVQKTRDVVAREVDGFKLFPSTKVVYRPAADGFDPRHQPMTEPTRVMIAQGDISDRRYRPIGEITTSVKKPALFGAAVTPERIDQRMRREAALIGAHAVIHAEYGHFGVESVTWGSLEGKGTAVRYID